MSLWWRSKRVCLIPAIMILVLGGMTARTASPGNIPENFVDAETIIPGIVLDMRYYTAHNFVGERIDGYIQPKCYLTRKAASALARVQEEIKPFALSLKIYDCYRPQRAVDHFVRWAHDIGDTRTKDEFYPTIDKRNLFKDGYIAQRSSHSRGSTVDLTIIPLPPSAQQTYTPGQSLSACYLPVEQRFRDNSIDMGTGFDCFHPLSNTANKNIPLQQKINRLTLKTIMEKQGFVNYEMEWWHFTLKDEPFTGTYFDFIIK